MKIYNVSFDSVSITVVLDDNQDLFEVLSQSDDWNCKDLYLKDDKIYKKWNATYSEECTITDMTEMRGVIHSEAH